ncbi:Bacterial Ig-like domain (group 1) [compost metagenome]
MTNSSITESVASQAKVYVNDDGEALVTPIPMQGAPVIIRDISGREMTQVFFDDEGTPTLDAEEDFETDGGNEIALMDTDIDESTLEVWVDENRTSSYTKVEEYALRNNIIHLRKTYPELTPVKVLYRVNRSFSVDYNFNPAEGYAMIKLHNPVLDDSREINVWFETNANSAYYLSSELNLNPMNNLLSEGFIYLTDSVEPAKKLDIRFNPNTLLGNGYDRTTILVIARDQFGNAVVGDTINFVVDHGEVTVIQAVTDENGLATAVYTAPVWTGVAELQVIDVTSRIESKASIIIKSPAAAPRITLTADKLTIDPDGSDTVKITARVMNGLQQPAAEAIVNFDMPEATVLNPVSTTNYIGEAYSYIQVAAVPPDGIITLKVRVSSLGITEYINIRVNE